jgi:RimJ/RimL family protein N-acetyltransferase
MIVELSQNEFEKARSVFRAMDCHLAVNSIIEGTTPGKIYVDDPAHPQAAITWTKHRFFLAGDAGNEAFNRALHRLFAKEIHPQATAAGLSALMVYYSPDSWADKLSDVILKDKLPVKRLRHCYAIGQLKSRSTFVPQGFALWHVDRDLLTKTDLQNRETLLKEMQSERPSIEEFLDKSFGFCILRGNEIIGWCLSEYNCQDQCEVGIETVAAYQRRGIGTLTATALVQHALAKGIRRVGWHCWSDHVASIATAKAVGFEKLTEYPVYLVYLKEAENLAAHGYECLKRRQYREARAWFEKAFQAGGVPTWAHHAVARAYAGLGSHEATFKHLNQVIDQGWTDISTIEGPEEFAPLRGTPPWKDLLARIEKERKTNRER